MSKFYALALAATLASSAGGQQTELRRFQFERPLMGAPIKVILYAADERSANLAVEAAYQRIADLDRILSDYKSDSELSHLSATAGRGRVVPVGRDLFTVLERSQQLADETGGAFDITVGPYVRLWRRARRAKQFPDRERLAEARQSVGHQKLKLDSSRHTAQLLAPAMRLDLGGIATGYAVDEAMKVLRSKGVDRALIDASGDILVSEAPPGEAGWKIGIAPLDASGPPSRYLRLSNMSVTTSGDAFQYVVLDGKRYSHIVDPATGLGLTDQASATVIASDCITADSMATAVCVLGPKKGLKLVEDTPRAAAFMVRSQGDEPETFASSRLAEYVTEMERAGR
jgi:FAD:protein FMN transferase